MTASPFILALSGWLFMALVIVLLYFVPRARKDAGIVDIGWTGGMGLLAVLYSLAADGDPPRRVVLAVLAGSWSFRLAFHLLRRHLQKKEEGRYRMLRERWREKAQSYFFLFFQVQALWAIMFSVPFLVLAYRRTRAPDIFDMLGIAVWIIGWEGNRWPTGSWPVSRQILPTGVRPAPVIRIISSSSRTGLPTSS